MTPRVPSNVRAARARTVRAAGAATPYRVRLNATSLRTEGSKPAPAPKWLRMPAMSVSTAAMSSRVPWVPTMRRTARAIIAASRLMNPPASSCRPSNVTGSMTPTAP